MITPDKIERHKALREELLPLATKTDALTDVERARYDEIVTEYDPLDAEIRDNDEFNKRRQADVERMKRVETPTPAVESFDTDPLGADKLDQPSTIKNPWDIEAVRRSADADELLSRALTAVEQTPGPNDVRRAALYSIVEGEGDERVARLVLATTSPDYKQAYGKIARAGGDVARANLTPDENNAVAYADSVRRAMSQGTDNTGGYLVPTDIEAAVTLSTDGTNNPIYSRARRVQTTSDTYRVVTSPHAAWSWDGENTEVSDDTPTFANTDIPLYIAQGFVPYSYAAAHGIGGITQVVSSVLMGGWNDLVGAALTTGTGSSQPTGLITALAGGSSEVASATTDTFAVADVYSTFNALPARHRRNATWLSSIEALGDIRQFGTADSHALLTRLADGEEGLRILGRPWVENEDMDNAINATQDNYYAVVGDLQHYVVAEGLGTVTRFIPDVVGGNGRPIGASAVFMQTQFGADSVLDGAFRLLNVT